MFLRELVVGVATPSNLAGSFIVKILHSGEGGDVEQVCSKLETNLPYLQLLISLSLTCVYILHACYNCAHLYMLDILVLNCYTCLGCLISSIAIHCIFIACLILCLH